MRYLILLIIASTTGSCISCGHNRPEEPDPVVIPAEGKELCQQACDVMLNDLVNGLGEKGCIEGTPVDAPPDIVNCSGDDCPELVKCSHNEKFECVTCTWYCEYAHDNGSYWNTKCIISDISSCGEIESTCNTQ